MRCNRILFVNKLCKQTVKLLNVSNSPSHVFNETENQTQPISSIVNNMPCAAAINKENSELSDEVLSNIPSAFFSSRFQPVFNSCSNINIHFHVNK